MFAPKNVQRGTHIFKTNFEIFKKNGESTRVTGAWRLPAKEGPRINNISSFDDSLSLQGPESTFKACGGGGGAPHWCETGPRLSPFVPSILSSVFFLLSLVLFHCSSKISFSPLQMPCQLSVTSVLLSCIPPHPPFLSSRSFWAAAVPPTHSQPRWPWPLSCTRLQFALGLGESSVSS